MEDDKNNEPPLIFALERTLDDKNTFMVAFETTKRFYTDGDNCLHLYTMNLSLL